jgi:drug/metabolite transporter (DMT)-like permease
VKARNNLLSGIFLTILAGGVFAGMDALGKHTTTLAPVLQIIWGRYVVQTLIVSGYLAATTGTAFLRTRHPVLQLVRGLLLLCATCLMYQALARVPLADATAVMFFSPIIVTILSVLLLREKIGLHRVGAVVAGFVGMLLILSPGFEEFDPALLLVVAGSLCNAGYLLMTRALASKENAPSTQFNSTAVGAILLSLVVIPQWGLPDLGVIAFLVALGAAGAAGHYALVTAFSHASASLLSPFLYSQVLIASVLSVLLFGDSLRPIMVIGTVTLVGSGLYLWWRESR